MRGLVGRAIVVLVLFAAGGMAWRAAALESRAADAHEILAVLQYEAGGVEYRTIEESIGYTRRVPWLTERLQHDLRERLTAVEYWQSRYDDLTVDESGGDDIRDPSLRLLEANAAFRATEHAGNRQTVLLGLDAALKRYGALLKDDPGDTDAAYNYEYVVRVRNAIAKTRSAAPAAPPAPPPPRLAGDLPAGRTIHGRPGSPPPDTDMSQFKMHIPVRPDERQSGSDAGQGRQKVRRG